MEYAPMIYVKYPLERKNMQKIASYLHSLVCPCAYVFEKCGLFSGVL
jgi:hypothetical protein